MFATGTIKVTEHNVDMVVELTRKSMKDILTALADAKAKNLDCIVKIPTK